MKKSTLFMILSLVLAVALSIGTTLAYLSDTDEDVNVMTLGNVHIEQLEYERVVDEDGNWIASEFENYGYTADEMQEFTQGKPLFPAVFADDVVKWDDRNGSQAPSGDGSHQQPWNQIDAPGSNQLFDDSVKNVIDKFVFVKNTGASDAYYRTIIAMEDPEENTAEIHTNTNPNSRFDWDRNVEGVQSAGQIAEKEFIYIDGVRYRLYVATYQEPLTPGEVSRPSFLQVFLNPSATNEDVAAFGDDFKILVVSQAVQTAGFDSPEAALNAAFGEISADNHPWHEDLGEDRAPTELENAVSTAEEFAAALASAGAPRSSDTTILLLKDIDASELDWEPVYVNGYQGAGVVTIKGNGRTISNLNAPLFKGGFAGKSGIVIENLTIKDSDIVSTNSTGAGAFIEVADSMQQITLRNCHLINSTVTGPDGSRAGGLIGWTSGYSNQNNGPVKTYVTIEDCSVVDCDITCGGSVGGLYGHAGSSDWTYSTVKNCTVKDCNLNSTDDGGWRVGVVVGTANVGEITIDGITESGNTLSQTGKTAPAGQSNLYGRFVPGSTGKLVIDGTEIN